MKSKLVILLSSAFILTSCVVAHRRGGGLEIIPILPTVLELDVEQPYYTQDGYYYYYTDDRWRYLEVEKRSLGRTASIPLAP